MRTTLMGAAGAFAVATVALTGAASAQQCWWNGLTTSCAAPATTPQVSAPYARTEGYGGGYAQPSYPAYSYPAYPYSSEGYSDYKPAWMPSYPGPRPSSGAGH